jgi:hypothetical protein
MFGFCYSFYLFVLVVVGGWGGGGGGAGPPPPKPPGSLADLQSRLDVVQREIRHLREQRDILKKTLGILSEPLPNATKGLMR